MGVQELKRQNGPKADGGAGLWIGVGPVRFNPWVEPEPVGEGIHWFGPIFLSFFLSLSLSSLLLSRSFFLPFLSLFFILFFFVSFFLIFSLSSRLPLSTSSSPFFLSLSTSFFVNKHNKTTKSKSNKLRSKIHIPSVLDLMMMADGFVWALML